MQRQTPGRQFQPRFPRAIKYDQNAGSFDLLQSTPPIEEHTTLLPAVPSPTRPRTIIPSVQPSTSLRPLIPPNSFRQIPSHSIRAKPYLPIKQRWKRKHTFLVLLLLASSLLLFLASLWLSSRASADVTLFQVQMQHSEYTVGGGGILYPRQQLNIAYPVAERVLAVLVHPGDQVAPDQPLLRLDTTQLQAQIQQAADNMTAAHSYLSSVSSNANAITIAQAQQQFALAKNKYTALLAQSAYPLTHTGNLVSSLQGVVTAININAGEVLVPNAVLLVIMDESALVVHMQVPLANVGQVRSGEQAQITPSALTDHVFPGMVSAMIPQANPQTATFEVRVSVNDPQHLLLPGMTVFVRIQVPTTALLVPRLAVLQLDQLATVFVVHSQHAYLHSVQVLGRDEDRFLVSSGLQSGAYIVLLGLSQLHDGQSIHIDAIEHSTGGTV
jgi:RND family efflux transporter MFP subunit